jgi:hypothetical protein
MTEDHASTHPKAPFQGRKKRTLTDAMIARKWKPGQSANPSGKRKDGLPSAPHPARIRESVLQALAAGNTTQRIASRLVRDALKGNYKAMGILFDRVWPITKDEGGHGRIVFEGLRLELPGGARAELIKGTLASINSSSPQAPLVLCDDGGYDVVRELSESHGVPLVQGMPVQEGSSMEVQCHGVLVDEPTTEAADSGP